jgi:UDP-N-acetylglucosamine 4-epimerase
LRRFPMSNYEQLQLRLKAEPTTWLVTGVAGFIGSHLLETLLKLNQQVTGLDNFSTGKHTNLDQVRRLVAASQWDRFKLIEGSVGDFKVCEQACGGAHFVLHQAALGSVPASIADPLACHNANATGFLNILIAARAAQCQRVIYASSSAVYGDDPDLPKRESKTGRPLSPYAATKAIDELYADAFAAAYGLGAIGLRYFNVFGPRQDPEGAYAAVIPKWIASLLKQEPVQINGDGETSRDFCFINNVVQANLLAATSSNPGALNQVYNVALGQRTTLNQLFSALQTELRRKDPGLPEQRPVFRDFRLGDIRHSVADISKAKELLGFAPTFSLDQGLRLAMEWYRQQATAA